MKCNDILEAIGGTPLVRLNRINQGLKPQIYVKAEFTNPGGSVKDRIGIAMIDDAEKKGLLKPGGTIIEGTSGNTGMGLALVAAVRGYKCVFTTTDKQSKEKVDLLKALGAEVIVCPTAVEPEDPRSYYSVAKKLAREIPNSYYPNQYDNPMNPEAHYQTTGPEIWDRTILLSHCCRTPACATSAKFTTRSGCASAATWMPRRPSRSRKSSTPNTRLERSAS